MSPRETQDLISSEKATKETNRALEISLSEQQTTGGNLTVENQEALLESQSFAEVLFSE